MPHAAERPRSPILDPQSACSAMVRHGSRVHLGSHVAATVAAATADVAAADAAVAIFTFTSMRTFSAR